MNKRTTFSFAAAVCLLLLLLCGAAEGRVARCFVDSETVVPVPEEMMPSNATEPRVAARVTSPAVAGPVLALNGVDSAGAGISAACSYSGGACTSFPGSNARFKFAVAKPNDSSVFAAVDSDGAAWIVVVGSTLVFTLVPFSTNNSHMVVWAPMAQAVGFLISNTGSTVYYAEHTGKVFELTTKSQLPFSFFTADTAPSMPPSSDFDMLALINPTRTLLFVYSLTVTGGQLTAQEQNHWTNSSSGLFTNVKLARLAYNYDDEYTDVLALCENGDLRTYYFDSYGFDELHTTRTGLETLPFLGVTNLDKAFGWDDDVILCFREQVTPTIWTVSCNAYLLAEYGEYFHEEYSEHMARIPLQGFSQVTGSIVLGELGLDTTHPDLVMSGKDCGVDITRLALDIDCHVADCDWPDRWGSCTADGTCVDGWATPNEWELFCVPTTAEIANTAGYCKVTDDGESSWCKNEFTTIRCSNGVAVEEPCVDGTCYYGRCLDIMCDMTYAWEGGCYDYTCRDHFAPVPARDICLPIATTEPDDFPSFCHTLVNNLASLFAGNATVAWDLWESGIYATCSINETYTIRSCPFVPDPHVTTPWPDYMPCNYKAPADAESSSQDHQQQQSSAVAASNSLLSLLLPLIGSLWLALHSSGRSSCAFLATAVVVAALTFSPGTLAQTTLPVQCTSPTIHQATFNHSCITTAIYRNGNNHALLCSTDDAVYACFPATPLNCVNMMNTSCTQLATRDIDGDNIDDIAFTVPPTGVVGILVGPDDSRKLIVPGLTATEIAWGNILAVGESSPLLFTVDSANFFHIFHANASFTGLDEIVAATIKDIDRILSIFDVDGDGNDELLLRNSSSGHAVLFRRVPGFIAYVPIFDANTEVALAGTWCDANADGHPDLVVAGKYGTDFFWGNLLEDDFIGNDNDGTALPSQAHIASVTCAAIGANPFFPNAVIACGYDFCYSLMLYMNGAFDRRELQVGSVLLDSGNVQTITVTGAGDFQNNGDVSVFGTLKEKPTLFAHFNCRACDCEANPSEDVGCNETTCMCKEDWELYWKTCYPRTEEAAQDLCAAWEDDFMRCINSTAEFSCRESPTPEITSCGPNSICFDDNRHCTPCECNTSEIQCDNFCLCRNGYSGTSLGICVPDDSFVADVDRWCERLIEGKGWLWIGNNNVDLSVKGSDTRFVRCSYTNTLSELECAGAVMGNTPFADRLPCGMAVDASTSANEQQQPSTASVFPSDSNGGGGGGGFNAMILLYTLLPIIVISALAAVLAVVLIKRSRRKSAGVANSGSSSGSMMETEMQSAVTIAGLKKCDASDLAGLRISPTTLSFGSGRAQIAVDKDVTETLRITNTGRKKTTWHLLLPECEPHKVKLAASHVLGEVSPDEEMAVEITLRFACTTSVDIPLHVVVAKKGYAEIHVKAESQLSAKLDPSEFVFGDVLGHGGFGTVYKGEWRGTSVAIKSYNETVVTDEILRNDLLREIDMCFNLRAPNIVITYGSAFTNKQCFLVMELVPLGSLGSILQKQKDLPLVWKVRVALDTARGMDFLHQNRIIHRDLKPDNVLVSSMDPRAAVVGKLSDFNTSRFIGSEANRTKTKGVGTPCYMAPEILDGKRYSQKADVYSFGILLWVLWTQQEPWHEQETQFGIYRNVLEGSRPEMPTTIPLSLQQITAASWAHVPDERPSFHDLLASLESVV